jgi:hypothetical protein
VVPTVKLLLGVPHSSELSDCHDVVAQCSEGKCTSHVPAISPRREIVGVLVSYPKLVPTRVSELPPEGGVLGRMCSVTTGASKVRDAWLLVPTRPVTVTWVYTLPTPGEVRHSRAVLVIHAVQPQVTAPTLAVAEVSEEKKLVPSRVKLLPSEVGVLNGCERVTTAASNVNARACVATVREIVTVVGSAAPVPAGARHVIVVAASQLVVAQGARSI